MKKVIMGIAFLIGMVGMIIIACDTPTLAEQMRNAAIGVATIAFAFLIGLAGEKIDTH